MRCSQLGVARGRPDGSDLAEVLEVPPDHRGDVGGPVAPSLRRTPGDEGGDRRLFVDDGEAAGVLRNLESPGGRNP